MRTVTVPTLCALVLALSACGGDETTADKTTPDDKIQQTTPPVNAEMKQRDGDFVLSTDTKKSARTICQNFRDLGQTEAGGKSKFPIATENGDYTCDLTKK